MGDLRKRAIGRQSPHNEKNPTWVLALSRGQPHQLVPRRYRFTVGRFDGCCVLDQPRERRWMMEVSFGKP